MAKKKEQTFVMNGAGIPVKRCCSSCMHKCLTSISQRTCSLHENKSVKKRDVCPAWRMAPCLENVGTNLGEVKKKSYLQFVMVRRWTEDKNIELGVMDEDDRQRVSELREEYVGRFGKIYL